MRLYEVKRWFRWLANEVKFRLFIHAVKNKGYWEDPEKKS